MPLFEDTSPLPKPLEVSAGGGGEGCLVGVFGGGLNRPRGSL